MSDYNNNFDRQMKSVLDNIEPEFDPSTWDMLAHKMDQAAFEEQPVAVDAVDKAVYHTLQRLEAPYQQAHWNALANRIQVVAVRVRRLRIAKLAEAAIFLLLLWNTESYWGTGTYLPPARPVFDPNVPVAQTRSGLPVASKKQTGHPHPSSKSPLEALAAKALQEQLMQPGSPSLLSGDYLMANSAAEILASMNQTAEQANLRVFAAAKSISPFLLTSRLLVPGRAVAFAQAPTPKFASQSPFFLAVYTVADNDRIGGTDGKNYSGSGYGAVLAGGFRPDKWGVEAGIGYSAKQYAPKQSVTIVSGNQDDGFYGSSLSEISADLLTVPVKITRRLAKMGRTSAHAVVGATANLALGKNHDYSTTYFPPGTLPPHTLPDPTPKPALASNGLLENGRLSDNIYATVDAGLRIEHRLGKGRHVAFVEPAFRQTFAGKGYGQQEEPVRSFSIQAGVLTYL
ncbi:MAG: hypothetical protein ACKVU2_01005 [Saprospiraceae bacterium]